MRNQNGGGHTQLIMGLILLVMLVLFIVLQSSPAEARPYDLTSPAPDGLRALALWLAEMGYDVTEISGGQFSLTNRSKVVFIFPSAHAYDRSAAAELKQWVAAGGVAIIIGPNTNEEELIGAFGVQAGARTPLLMEVRPQQPSILNGVTSIDLSGELPALDLVDAPAAVPILADKAGRVTVAVQAIGAGVVWHVSRHHTFINAQLRDPAQAALLLAILRTTPMGATVVFDTYHLLTPAIPTAVTTLQEWLYSTFPGWALLFALTVTAIFLILQGRRLGPRYQHKQRYVRAKPLNM